MLFRKYITTKDGSDKSPLSTFTLLTLDIQAQRSNNAHGV